MKSDLDKESDQAYLLITELLSVISFESDCKIIPESGSISYGKGFDLAKVSGGYVARRSIPVYEVSDEFWYIPPIRTQEQSSIIRLYREARSSNNIYLSILFYWHILTYPNTDESEAVRLLNAYVLDQKTGEYTTGINRIIENPIMLKRKESFKSFGEYVNSGVRHSIAHIVRPSHFAEKSIAIDDFEQLRHLNDVKDVIKGAARSRIRNEFRVNEPHDMSIFSYTRHSDFRNSIK